MSRQSGIHVDGPAGTVARLRSRALQQPYLKESLDVFVRGLGMPSSKILAHQLESSLEQVQRSAEGLDERRSWGFHSWAQNASSPSIAARSLRLLYGFRQ